MVPRPRVVQSASLLDYFQKKPPLKSPATTVCTASGSGLAPDPEQPAAALRAQSPPRKRRKTTKHASQNPHDAPPGPPRAAKATPRRTLTAIASIVALISLSIIRLYHVVQDRQASRARVT